LAAIVVAVPILQPKEHAEEQVAGEAGVASEAGAAADPVYSEVA